MLPVPYGLLGIRGNMLPIFALEFQLNFVVFGSYT
jgi:hypothetical protein